MFKKSVCHVWRKYYSVKVLENENSIVNVKEYAQIPGPKGFLNMGTVFNYLPIIGNYSYDELHLVGLAKFRKYGKIVREQMLPGVDIVWLFDPKDIAAVLNDYGQGIYPRRMAHCALEKYRKDRPHMYRTGGLLPTNGLEWWKIRSEVQKSLSAPSHVRNFLPHADKITCEFVDQFKTVLESDDFLPELSRLNLELICLHAFGMRMDCFSESQRQPNSVSSKLIESAENAASCVLQTDQGFKLYRFFETPIYRKFRKSIEFLESVAIQLLAERLAEKQNSIVSSYHSLLDIYLENPNLEIRDVVGMSTDMFLAGIDTTSYTSSFLLYYIARDKRIQLKLYDEAIKVLPSPAATITSNAMNSDITYTRAVLKESLRMNPISVGVGRILNRDIVLSDYLVPKGTTVVTQNQIACRLEENFSAPNEFIPERWLKEPGNSNSPRNNPYLVLPFGHGMRACIARRLAEQNMLILILRLVRNYEIDWIGDDELQIKTKLINKPAQNIKLKFKLR